jgi:hypothetical protein
VNWTRTLLSDPKESLLNQRIWALNEAALHDAKRLCWTEFPPTTFAVLERRKPLAGGKPRRAILPASLVEGSGETG